MPKGRPKKQLPKKESVSVTEELTQEERRTVETRPEVPEPTKYSRPLSPKWDLQDVKIPKKEKLTTWPAVFKCTNPQPMDPQTGMACSPHKTKATNRTPAKDVPCHKCGWPTEMVDIFLHPPVDYGAMRVREPDGGDFEGVNDA